MVVYRVDHVLGPAAAVVYDLDREQVTRCAVLHLYGDTGGSGTDGVVGDVYYVQVEAFHSIVSLALRDGGRT